MLKRRSCESVMNVLRYDCGSGTTRVRSNNTVHLFQWNVIKVDVTGRHGNVQLNGGQQHRRRTKAR